MDTNLVLPLGPDRCRVVFDFYFADTARPRTFIAESIAVADQVQAEDVGVCEEVQRGLNSRSYTTGRFSVRREAGCGISTNCSPSSFRQRQDQYEKSTEWLDRHGKAGYMPRSQSDARRQHQQGKALLVSRFCGRSAAALPSGRREQLPLDAVPGGPRRAGFTAEPLNRRPCGRHGLRDACRPRPCPSSLGRRYPSPDAAARRPRAWPRRLFRFAIQRRRRDW